MASDVLLEFSLRCFDLSVYDNFTGPSTFVSVQCIQPESGFWTQHSQTDIVHSSVQPVFKNAIKFCASHRIDLSTRLRFVLYSVKKTNIDIVTEIGSCHCFVKDLIQKHRQFTFSLQMNHGSFAGHMCISVSTQKLQMKQVNKQGKTVLPLDETLAESTRPPDHMRRYGELAFHPLFPAIYSFEGTISRSYRFPLQDEGRINAEEKMLESRLTYYIPILYLNICANEENKKITDLESLGQLKENWENLRKSKLAEHNKQLAKYHERLQFLMSRYGRPHFKRSVDKTFTNLDFVATNLHLQRLKVEQTTTVPVDQNQDSPSSSSSSPITWVDYDIITVGAATNHSIGFKQGGLLAQLTNAIEGGKSKNSLPLDLIDNCLKRMHLIPEEERVILGINRLKEQIKYQTEKLRVILVRSSSSPSQSDIYSDTLTSATEALASLSQKVCDLVTCCEGRIVSGSVTSFAHARSSSNHSSPAMGPRLPTTDRTSSPVMNGNSTSVPSSDENLPEVLWEEQTLQVKSTLSDVVRSAHIKVASLDQSLQADLRSASPSRSHQAEEDLTLLLELIEKLCFDSISSLTFATLQTPSSTVDLLFRRNSVFCQALTICICGVSTLILSSLQDPIKLQQFAEVGVFLQVESLISNYGNELSMLQDYAVGILDQENVSFKCVRYSPHLSTDTLASLIREDSEKYLPSIRGSTDTITVSLPFDDESFDLLPTNLQQGKLIKVFPVLFNVGINEEQTLAERFGNTNVQDYLNVESWRRTLKYYDMVRDRCPSAIGEPLRNANSFINEADREVSPERKTPSQPLMGQLMSLDVAVHSKKMKHVEILQLAADICRRLNGVRLTSCKSAKDRTAMGVTLEQMRILTNNHGLATNVFSEALACMRSEGTRRENTLKNTGNRKYAFTSIQLLTFPKIYRAPDGTYGKGET